MTDVKNQTTKDMNEVIYISRASLRDLMLEAKDEAISPMRATVSACWDALGQARAHIAGETPDETSQSREEIAKAILEMIDEAIQDCRRMLA